MLAVERDCNEIEVGSGRFACKAMYVGTIEPKYAEKACSFGPAFIDAVLSLATRTVGEVCIVVVVPPRCTGLPATSTQLERRAISCSSSKFTQTLPPTHICTPSDCVHLVAALHDFRSASAAAIATGLVEDRLGRADTDSATDFTLRA